MTTRLQIVLDTPPPIAPGGKVRGSVSVDPRGESLTDLELRLRVVTKGRGDPVSSDIEIVELDAGPISGKVATYGFEVKAPIQEITYRGPRIEREIELFARVKSGRKAIVERKTIAVEPGEARSVRVASDQKEEPTLGCAMIGGIVVLAAIVMWLVHDEIEFHIYAAIAGACGLYFFVTEGYTYLSMREVGQATLEVRPVGADRRNLDVVVTISPDQDVRLARVYIRLEGWERVKGLTKGANWKDELFYRDEAVLATDVEARGGERNRFEGRLEIGGAAPPSFELAEHAIAWRVLAQIKPEGSATVELERAIEVKIPR